MACDGRCELHRLHARAGRVVPGMVERDSGHVVITSSITAYRGLPKSIGYTASKAATLSLAECMHADLQDTGVVVQAALPGFIKTRLTDKNDFNMPQIMAPEVAAQRDLRIDELGDAFKSVLPRGFGLRFCARRSSCPIGWTTAVCVRSKIGLANWCSLLVRFAAGRRRDAGIEHFKTCGCAGRADEP